MEMYEAMQQLAEVSGNIAAEVRAWNLLARAHRYLGQARHGLECARRAEILARAEDISRKDLARALAMQGWCYHALGQPEQAIDLAERGWALSREADARREMALNLNLLGVAHDSLGRYEEGATYGYRALEVYRAMGNRWGMGIISNNLGENARARGDYATALRYCEQALTVATETGNRESQISCYNNMGGARLGLGQFEAAEEALQEVLARVRNRDWFGLSETYRFLAEAYLGQKRTKAALAAAREALAIAEEKEQPDAAGSAWRVLGQVAATLDQPIRVDTVGEIDMPASKCFAESERSFAAAGMAAERARVLHAWGNYEQKRGNWEDAKRLSTKAESIYKQLGITPGWHRDQQP
jgi:tetratricopeptide (TPR) repeat protein